MAIKSSIILSPSKIATFTVLHCSSANFIFCNSLWRIRLGNPLLSVLVKTCIFYFSQMESHWKPSPIFLYFIWALRCKTQWNIMVYSSISSLSCSTAAWIHHWGVSRMDPLSNLDVLDRRYWLVWMLTSKVPPELSMPMFKILTNSTLVMRPMPCTGFLFFKTSFYDIKVCESTKQIVLILFLLYFIYVEVGDWYI